MTLRMPYGGRTYRCLKKVIKERQEERKKKVESLLQRKVRTILHKTNSSHQHLQNGKSPGHHFNRRKTQGLRTAYRVAWGLTCPKKATRK